MYTVLNFYKFTPIEDPEQEKNWQEKIGAELGLTGTVLLAKEGINVGLSGTTENLDAYVAKMQARESFSDIQPFYSVGETKPFTRFKIKIKDYIVVFPPDYEVEMSDIKNDKAPHLSPDKWRELLQSESDDVVVIDTRNYYEIDYGHFKEAKDLGLRKFRDFPEKFLEKYADQKDKTFLMYCTGGIRCEKAAVFAKNFGFNNVYQLEGGIINYLKQHGNDHYKGSCFVFDHRWAIDKSMSESADGPHPDQLDRVPDVTGL